MTSDSSEPSTSAFEAHLDRVVRATWVAQAIHQVTHPGCTDVRHLTALDKARAEAAIDAMHAYRQTMQPPAGPAGQEPQ